MTRDELSTDVDMMSEGAMRLAKAWASGKIDNILREYQEISGTLRALRVQLETDMFDNAVCAVRRKGK